MKTKTILVFMALVLLTGCKAKNENTSVTSIENNQITVINDISKDFDLQEEVTENAMDKGILYSEKQENVISNMTDSIICQGSSCMLMPVLQNPTADSVTVQWFTDGCCTDNEVFLYEGADADAPFRVVNANSYKMSRLRGGNTEKTCNDATISSNIYKHTAYVDNLPEYHGYESERVYYRISSDGKTSGMYSLSALPAEGTPLRILLTSDLQIKKMCAANYQKVFETVGHVDAVFCNGDLADVPDRAYDWFYADNAFWRVFTGTAEDEIEGRTYYGAPLLQEAPIYTSIGNHDVMGVYDENTDLSVQFNSPSARLKAEKLWENYNSSGDYTEEEKANYISDHSYNSITYEEMFELPSADSDTKKYYSAKLGDIGLIVLDVSRVWKLPNVGIMGKYSELPGTKDKEYGDFIFEPVSEGSDQINFLKKSLNSDDFQKSKYKVVMFHSEAHSLGDNAVPAFTDPVIDSFTDSVTGLNMTVYNYPLSKDYIHNIIEPLAESAGTNLLFNAHSHLWNRFVTVSGMNVLESSNVGNTYGGYLTQGKRSTVPTVFNKDDPMARFKNMYNEADYPAGNDPFGLEPISPNIESLPDGMPYLSSNSITAFSILDTGKGSVDSYYYNIDEPEKGVVWFDSFQVVNYPAIE